MISEHEVLRTPDDWVDLIDFWNQVMDALPDESNITTPEAVLLNRILAMTQIGAVKVQPALALAWAIGKGLVPLEDFDNIPAAVQRERAEHDD